MDVKVGLGILGSGFLNGDSPGHLPAYATVGLCYWQVIWGNWSGALFWGKVIDGKAADHDMNEILQQWLLALAPS